MGTGNAVNMSGSVSMDEDKITQSSENKTKPGYSWRESNFWHDLSWDRRW